MEKIVKPLFFVFTCVKDGRKYISKLFESMLNQTKKNFVHYIYEDGSIKPLGDMINEYRKKALSLNTPFEVIYEYNPINIGLIKSTQHCISKCTGLYYIWIDCDNYINSSFFEEMEKLYKKHKNALLLRSFLYEVKEDNEQRHCEWHKYKTANRKYQLGIYIRKKYYYSFFAVHYRKYVEINPQNFMINERFFYNDEQVIFICLLNTLKAPVSKKAISYFLVHKGQESSTYIINDEERNNYLFRLAEKIDHKSKLRVEVMFKIKYLYDELFRVYTYDFYKSKNIINEIRKLSKEYNISLKNFYNYNLIKNTLKIYWWRFKKRWKN